MKICSYIVIKFVTVFRQIKSSLGSLKYTRDFILMMSCDEKYAFL